MGEKGNRRDEKTAQRRSFGSLLPALLEAQSVQRCLVFWYRASLLYSLQGASPRPGRDARQERRRVQADLSLRSSECLNVFGLRPRPATFGAEACKAMYRK